MDVAVLAAHADRVEFCVVEPPDSPGSPVRERRVDLPELTHGVWHGYVPDVGVGQEYGFRVHGRWEPARGHRHNPNKLLLDPYARALSGPLHLVPELFGHTVGSGFAGDGAIADLRDSAPFAPRGVLVDESFDWGDDRAPDIPWSHSIVYEAHVRGLTMQLPGVPPHLRGSYAAIGHPAVVEHLRSLGVTTLELLPVHAIGTESSLARRGLPNYWGYSTLGFFAPHPGYAADGTPGGAVREFKGMVRTLHEAGIEVVLDVVYNHTCEGGPDGPMLSWKGLDAATYYRLDGHGAYVDTTGCGNTLDFSHPRVIQQALDSLRYWVQQMHVDGFRFDLAVTLARARDGFDPDHPFLVALRTDPVLCDVKLIAEPWDVGPHGWRTGQFPPPFTEWNDRFRDSVRDFWLGGLARATQGESSSGVRDLATRLAGSADTFHAVRGPLASVNFVTAHDGFTLADTTAFDRKHNEANGEGNRDGSDNNRSWNHGVEGPTDDQEILGARLRSHRNILGTLLLATGVPMITSGDEFGRSQGGNNNAYCHDGPLSWVDWDLTDPQEDLFRTTRHLVRLRRDHPVLRQDRFFAGRPVHPDGTKDLAWFGPDGVEMDHARWHDAALRTLQMYLHAVVPTSDGRHSDESLLVLVQGVPDVVEVTLPGPPWGSGFSLLWDSAEAHPPARGQDPVFLDAGATFEIAGPSMRVYGVRPVPDHTPHAH